MLGRSRRVFSRRKFDGKEITVRRPMEPNKNAFLVGLFVLLLVGGAIGSGLWLSQAGREEEPERYAIYFVKQTLSGLESGASVTMLGISVGKVEEVSIDPADFTRVRVAIALTPDTPITKSTTAVVKRNLLTGLATIELEGSSPTSPRVVGVRKKDDDRLPQIAEGLPQIVQIQRTLPVILDHTDKLLTSAGEVLNEGNREKLARIIGNIEVMSGSLSQGTATMKETVDRLSSVVQGFITHLDERSARISESFDRSSADLSRQVGTVSGNLNDTLRSITRLVEELEDPRRLLLGPSREDMGPGEMAPQ